MGAPSHDLGLCAYERLQLSEDDASRQRIQVSGIGAGLLTTCLSNSTETRHMPVRLNTVVFDVVTMDVWNFLLAERKLDDFAAEHCFESRIGFRYGGLREE
jgi:hypothetical protein